VPARKRTAKTAARRASDGLEPKLSLVLNSERTDIIADFANHVSQFPPPPLLAGKLFKKKHGLHGVHKPQASANHPGTAVLMQMTLALVGRTAHGSKTHFTD
jgi:hypothetical protein